MTTTHPIDLKNAVKLLDLTQADELGLYLNRLDKLQYSFAAKRTNRAIIMDPNGGITDIERNADICGVVPKSIIRPAALFVEMGYYKYSWKVSFDGRQVTLFNESFDQYGATFYDRWVHHSFVHLPESI